CLFDSPFSHFWPGPTMVLRGRLFGFTQSPHGIYLALRGHDAAVVGAGSRDLQQTWFRSRSHRHTHRCGGNECLDCGRSAVLADIRGYDRKRGIGRRRRMIVGNTLDTLVQNLMARTEIERVEQLRGKTLGITRFGTSIDVGARIALRHFGLLPEKDVAIVQVGGMESMVPALQSNRIQAGILSYPAIAQA